MPDDPAATARAVKMIAAGCIAAGFVALMLVASLLRPLLSNPACTLSQVAGTAIRWSFMGPLPLLAIGLLLRVSAARVSASIDRLVRRRG